LSDDCQKSRSAIVAGGTGLVGGALLDLLARDPIYHQTTSLIRRERPAPPGVTLRQVDFERLEELTLTPLDDAFCCLGTTRRDAGSAAAFRRVDLDYVVAFGQLAKHAGARRFMLVSSLGASPDSSFLYPRTKGECEVAISAIGFSTLVIVRPSFLVGARVEPRAAEAVALACRQTDTAYSRRPSSEVRTGGCARGSQDPRQSCSGRSVRHHDHRIG